MEELSNHTVSSSEIEPPSFQSGRVLRTLGETPIYVFSEGGGVFPFSKSSSRLFHHFGIPVQPIRLEGSVASYARVFQIEKKCFVNLDV